MGTTTTNRLRTRVAVLVGALVLAVVVTACGGGGGGDTSTGNDPTTTVAGTGAAPLASNTVRVHYRGTLANGQEFDSSYKRNAPASFPLGRVIPCWTEGVQSIKVGGKAKLLCPPNLAYGARGVPGVIPPDSVLAFEVELLDIAK